MYTDQGIKMLADGFLHWKYWIIHVGIKKGLGIGRYLVEFLEGL